MLSDATRAKLKTVSTATPASAPCERGLHKQTVQDVRPLSPPRGGSMVGEAYTLRSMPACEDLNPPTEASNLAAFEAWRKESGR